MKNHVTQLLSLVMCLLFNIPSLTGQNITDLSLKIGEEMGDSIVCYYPSGVKYWSLPEVSREPACRVVVDLWSDPDKIFVEVGITPDFLGRSRYSYDANSTDATFIGTYLTSLTYRLDYGNGEETRKDSYFYNERGQITLIERKDGDDNLLSQEIFYYNENGDLKLYENPFWKWIYDGKTNKPIPGTDQLASINGLVWEFDAQGKKTRTEYYRENLIYADEPKGKTLAYYVTFYYSDQPTSNQQSYLTKSQVYVIGNTLYIETACQEQISVYSINGSKLYGALIQPGTTSIDITKLTKGLVIIQGSSGWTKKVMIN